MNFEALIKDTVKQAVLEVFAEQQINQQQAASADKTPTLTAKQASEEFGISTIAIYNWMHQTDCDFYIPVGRKKIILRDKFVRWLNERTMQGGE